MLQYNNLKSVFSFLSQHAWLILNLDKVGNFQTKHIMYNEPFARGNNI